MPSPSSLPFALPARARSTPRPVLLGLALCAVLVPGRAAIAQDAWLTPTRAAAPPGVDVTFDLTSGTAFPAHGIAVPPLRVRDARVRLGGSAESFPAPMATRDALHFRTPLRTPGVATAWLSLAPIARTLDSAGVVRYLAERGAPDSVRVAYLRQLPIDGVRRWHERASAHAVTHVLVTSPLRRRPASDRSWSEPAGAPLELVPERDPTTLRAGDTLVVQLLRRGRPAGGVAVRTVDPRAVPAPLRRTGDDGRLAVVLPRAGRWLLRAADLRRAAASPTAWESEVTTLTVAVR
jgi:hypothetical protein